MKLSRIRVAFQIVLHLVLVGHVIAYYAFGWTRIGAIDFQAFFHYFLGEGLLTAGALFALLMFGGALVFGRLFCSWGCHFGATQDLAAWVLRKAGWKPPLVRTRFLHHAPYVVLIAVFLLPLLSRWTEKGLGTPRVDMAAVAPWDTLPGWFLSIVTFLACGAGILVFLGTRGFCRFVCPYGAVFRLTDRAAVFKVRKVRACGSGCGGSGAHPCTAACPTAIDVHHETQDLGRVVSVDCVRCNLCIEACPAGALAHVTAGAAARRLGVDEVKGAFVPAPAPAASRPAYDLPAAGEAVILGVSIVTYLAVDLVYGGHFLAATIALAQGFLAWTVLLAIRGSPGGAVLGFPLRRGGRWTFAGITAVGLFAISSIPIAEAGAFRLIRADGLRLDSRADPLASRPRLEEGPRRLGTEDVSSLIEERRRLSSAAERYRLALVIFPSDLSTRKLLLGAYARLGDPRALDEARELARQSPEDAWAREALQWTEKRFGRTSSAGGPAHRSRPE